MAAQSAERDNRTMDSPQHHRTPHARRSPGPVAPINLGLPLHAPLPAPGNDPFLAAPVPALGNNPFLAAPVPAPAAYNGHQYNHLPAALAQQLAAIPPMPVRGRGRGRGHGRGRGQGHGHGQDHAPAPAAMVC
jgi:hypothetical protein